MNEYSGSLKQRLEQFDTQHGNDGIVIGGWLVFSDGAMRETQPLGAWIDPPEDSYKRSKIQLQYREEMLRRAECAFNELKKQLQRQADECAKHANANTPPEPPSAQDVQKLKGQQAAVLRCREELSQAQERVSRAKPQWMRDRETHAAEIREANAQVISDLASINI